MRKVDVYRADGVEMRKRLTSCAVALAANVGYSSAGTVEYVGATWDVVDLTVSQVPRRRLHRRVLLLGDEVSSLFLEH